MTKRRNAAAVVADAEESLGAALLAAFVEEIKQLNNIWAKLSAEQQDSAINRIRERIGALIPPAMARLLAGTFPAAAATLDKVAFKSKSIDGTVTFPRNSEHRHTLADYASQQVVVVMASLEDYTAGMESIRGEADQRALDLEEGRQDKEPPDGDETYDALLLTDVRDSHANEVAVFAWDDAQRLAAHDWAMAVHLHASDNPEVVVPPMPDHVATLEFGPAPQEGKRPDDSHPGRQVAGSGLPPAKNGKRSKKKKKTKAQQQPARDDFITPALVSDLLQLTEAQVPDKVVKSWNREQLQAAHDWATDIQEAGRLELEQPNTTQDTPQAPDFMAQYLPGFTQGRPTPPEGAPAGA